MKNFLQLTCACTLSVLISSCGGGGGGSGGSSNNSTPAPATPVTTTPAPATPVPATPTPAPTPATTPVEAEVDYSPDPNLLDSTAENTGELYVGEHFKFEQTQQISLDLSVHDADGDAAAFKQISIYAFTSDQEELTDEAIIQAPLLLTATTDEQGRISQTVEWPADVKAIALKVDVIGIQSQAIIKIDTQQIAYDFR